MAASEADVRVGSMLLKKPSMISPSPSDGAFSYVFVSVVGSFLAKQVS